jgi:TPP-dependent indolepyruvate ferredoxin oxidoreductase alpha subunit
MFEGAKYDGVFGLWYGKGPGVDRCGDVFKHANAAGTSPRGGVLVVAGDDHSAKSSTLPHQSDHILKACGIPVLFPASVQEILDYGVLGWAMSRYAGLWVGMKCITDIVEVSATVDVDHRGPAKLGPNADKGLLEESVSLEIIDERGEGLVELTTSLRDKVRWLEESEAFSLQFPANRRRAVAEGRLEGPQGS